MSVNSSFRAEPLKQESIISISPRKKKQLQRSQRDNFKFNDENGSEIDLKNGRASRCKSSQSAFRSCKQDLVKQLCDSSFLFKRKAHALKGLGDVNQKMQKFENALKLHKKALQYAWFTENEEIEITLYEDIGLDNFYMGNLKDATCFHQRYDTFTVEKKGSFLKQMSNNDIVCEIKENLDLQSQEGSEINDILQLDEDFKKQAQQQFFKVMNGRNKGFNPNVFIKISLPLYNKYVKLDYIQYQIEKTINLNKIQYKQLLDEDDTKTNDNENNNKFQNQNILSQDNINKEETSQQLLSQHDFFQQTLNQSHNSDFELISPILKRRRQRANSFDYEKYQKCDKNKFYNYKKTTVQTVLNDLFAQKEFKNELDYSPIIQDFNLEQNRVQNQNEKQGSSSSKTQMNQILKKIRGGNPSFERNANQKKERQDNKGFSFNLNYKDQQYRISDQFYKKQLRSLENFMKDFKQSRKNKQLREQSKEEVIINNLNEEKSYNEIIKVLNNRFVSNSRYDEFYHEILVSFVLDFCFKIK
ncbi:hypothetical protein PPERSA_01456 [Pseudocohnilembus persalinus]|uniref:Tetratricopeptide repeat n=1 Tax=Pseudocohnilembus persalinus TaxID=266149 RepID=A0A0V0QGY8_PSEPJ|nr:hypothetical protein PPERSA_01456 [Pseudocohnilembus persalinus]|eukprot:KRX01553.1 hypothetical protein PPERSA_01456 [Pseudocohnilembus persalinus]